MLPLINKVEYGLTQLYAPLEGLDSDMLVKCSSANQIFFPSAQLPFYTLRCLNLTPLDHDITHYSTNIDQTLATD